MTTAAADAASQLLRMRGCLLLPFGSFPPTVNDADDDEYNGG
jgi:hypothetical protein